MNIWSENFVWFAIGMGFLSWYLTKWCWRSSLYLPIRGLICAIISFLLLTISGILLVMLVYFYENGIQRLVNGIYSNPFGSLTYLTETGWETGVFWLPIAIIRIGFLSWKSAVRNGRLDTEH